MGTVPELKCGHPIWWHHHGQKIEVFQETKECLILKGSAASLTIQKAERKFPDLEDFWLIDWEVIQCRPTEEIVKGRRLFTTENLKNAFGLTDGSGTHDGGWLIKRYGADAAEQMNYIRWGNYLNIPCPGTGNDGDPNISIEIDDEIQKAIARLIVQY
ncbi:MAG TPA: hypothetical protein VMC41_02550 [Candidatus Nanoarchaeia archaeon]|nr:hypothetical protein [Candidatus Nanoarchaeia archaeon]